jgi:plastocyanin
MLQLPDQTLDLAVKMPEGKYYFQCDPHVLLGMKGKLEVEK